jgi:serine protease Do
MQTKKTFGRGLLDKVRSGGLGTTFTVLAAVTVGILVGSVWTGKVSGMERQSNSADARPLTIPNPVKLSNTFSEIVKQDGPAVVNINTISLPKAAKAHKGGGPSEDQQNQMQDFFNKFFGGQPGAGGDDGGGDDSGPMGQGGGEREALGSGFIVDPRGYIITNNHVVEKADKIFVRLSNEPDSVDQGHPATVIGVDPETDIAVIKIDVGHPLPTVKMGNSDGPEVGDWVIAIGSPLGERNTVSAGIVSAKDREVNEPSKNGIASGQFQRFIQTDAAINPGNSGGPLIDMAGEVIGMNTAIYTQSMGSEGIGFAMPSNTIINVYDQLIGPDHKVVRGSIGITFQPEESSAVARVYGFQGGGVIVATVSPTGAAAKAGIQPGDVITTLDGRHIKNGDDLVNDISQRHPGTTVKVGYLRNGSEGSTVVTIADRQKTYADLTGANSDQNAGADQPDAGESKLGITVDSVPASQQQKLGITGGVIVTTAKPGSFADTIGLGRGSVITAINRKPVGSLADYKAIVNQLKSGEDVVFVIRNQFNGGGGNSYVGGTLP